MYISAPEAVTELDYEQSYGNDNVIKIIMKWMVSSLFKSCMVMSELILALKFLQPPPSSTRPHVIGYTVSHNASGTVQMYDTTYTSFVMESASPSLFVFTVVAVNVLGTGEESDITSEFCGTSLLFCIYTLIYNHSQQI